MHEGEYVGAAGPKPRLGMQSPGPFFASRWLKDYSSSMTTLHSAVRIIRQAG